MTKQFVCTHKDKTRCHVSVGIVPKPSNRDTMLSPMYATTRAPVVHMSATSAPRKAAWKPGEVAPAHLDGSFAGDAGFDPLLFTALAKKKPLDLVNGGWPSMNQRYDF